ncbi:MAG: sulfopyruvate decarboxylase alpha subunit [Gammaproteobacteria bacterium]|jgi:sulfopyruvate decarboxylase alpha subunit
MAKSTTKSAPKPPDWPKQVHQLFAREKVSQIAYVPDAGHKQLIELCQARRSMRCVPLTSEEEGVAMLAGAWLGGARGVLLMQSSGVGNCINMLGMMQECRFPLLTLVTMRGEWGEFNPWQIPMGQSTAAVLRESGVIVQPVDDPEDVVETVESAWRLAFHSYRAVAVLISQRVIGTKDFK